MSRWRAALGVLALALLAGAVLVILTAGPAPYVVKVELTDADGLQANFDVREQGVVVGHVARVALTPGWSAIATLDLDPAAAPIGAGASASIQTSNLLGEKYVQLAAGDLHRPQPSGTTIPLSRTSAATDLDQVLDAFNPDTRQATAVFLSEEGNALLGRGRDLATLLGRLPTSLGAAQQLLAGLGHDNAALGRLVDQSDRILRAAAPQRLALARLVSAAGGAFATLASRERALGETVTAAPGAVAQLHSTLVALQAAAGPLGLAAAGLRTTAPSLTQTLNAVPAFATAARPTVEELTRAAPALTELGTEGSPVVRALRPAGGALEKATTALAPISRAFAQHIGQLLDVAQGWARAIADRDGVGHMYRIEVLFPSGDLPMLLDYLLGK